MGGGQEERSTPTRRSRSRTGGRTTGSTGTAASSRWTSSRGSGGGSQRLRGRTMMLEEETFGGEIMIKAGREGVGKKRKRSQKQEEGAKKEVGTPWTTLAGKTRLLVSGQPTKPTSGAFLSMSNRLTLILRRSQISRL